MDPYLFANFITDDGDLLSATFRAFKFPESTYVQFRGTVNVCLDKCRGVSIALFKKKVTIKYFVFKINALYRVKPFFANNHSIHYNIA